MDDTQGTHGRIVTTGKSGVKRRFCSECGTLLNVDARFCHDCGSPIEGRPAGARAASGAPSPSAWRWGVPAVAVIALVLLMIFQFGSRSPSADSAATVPLGARAAPAPDISSMSPEDRADRLFNRVMRLSSEGKADSAAFFASMAMGALEALTPLDAHRRYDMGLIALVTGNPRGATAQADTILSQHRSHLLGLALAARSADARGDAAAASGFRRRLLTAEAAERARALPEYTDHDADIRAAVELARKR